MTTTITTGTTGKGMTLSKAAWDCGCANRKNIMITNGNLGLPEMLILGTVSIALVLSAWKAYK